MLTLEITLFLGNKMKSIMQHSLLNCSAKQAGFMPTSWQAISGNSYDRTPEGIGVQEGAGYA
jgi:hypothetical protein